MSTNEDKVRPSVLATCVIVLAAIIWLCVGVTREANNTAPTKTVVTADVGKSPAPEKPAVQAVRKLTESTNVAPVNDVPSGEGAEMATNPVFASRPKVAIHVDLNKFRRQLEAQAEVPVK